MPLMACIRFDQSTKNYMRATNRSFKENLSEHTVTIAILFSILVTLLINFFRQLPDSGILKATCYRTMTLQLWSLRKSSNTLNCQWMVKWQRWASMMKTRHWSILINAFFASDGFMRTLLKSLFTKTMAMFFFVNF